jgi:hypothetical protein
VKVCDPIIYKIMFLCHRISYHVKLLHKVKLVPLSYNPNTLLESSHLLFYLNNCLLLEVSGLLDQSATKIINYIISKEMKLELKAVDLCANHMT